MCMNDDSNQSRIRDVMSSTFCSSLQSSPDETIEWFNYLIGLFGLQHVGLPFRNNQFMLRRNADPSNWNLVCEEVVNDMGQDAAACLFMCFGFVKHIGCVDGSIFKNHISNLISLFGQDKCLIAGLLVF